MTENLDPRPRWIRQRTRDLHQSGLGWIQARKQAEAEADDKFGGEENGHNGNGNGATA